MSLQEELTKPLVPKQLYFKSTAKVAPIPEGERVLLQWQSLSYYVPTKADPNRLDMNTRMDDYFDYYDRV